MIYTIEPCVKRDAKNQVSTVIKIVIAFKPTFNLIKYTLYERKMM